MQEVYIKESFRLLLKKLKESFEERFNKTMTIRVVALALYVVFIVGIYLTLWQTFVQKTLNEVEYKFGA